MMRVLTDWFPGTILPVRDGLYIVQSQREAWEMHVCRFEHGKWLWMDGLRAIVMHDRRSRWRGLAFDPEAAVPWVYDGIYITKKGNKAYIIEVPR